MTTALFPAYKQAIKSLLDEGCLKDGSRLTKDQLARLFGLQAPSTALEQEKFQLQFLTAMVGFRDTLLAEHCLALKTLHGHGAYEVIPAAEQTDHALRVGAAEISAAMRRMNRTLLFVRTDELTDEQRKKNTDALAKSAMLASMIGRKKLLLS